MNKAIKYLLVAVLVLSTNLLNAKILTAYFSYATFTSPGSGPYIETYFTILGNSVEYIPMEEGKYQGTIEITLIFKQGAEIKEFKKYNLLSPALADTNFTFNFIDQQRISLPSGDYDLEIEIKDVYSSKKPFKANQKIGIHYNDKILFSDVQLMESFKKSTSPSVLTKSGFDIIPYVSDFYPEEVNKIKFYTELYNTKKVLGDDGMFLINYMIESEASGAVVNENRRFMRKKAADVCIVMNEFDIDKLPSGNYNLVFEARNKENELIASQRLFFQRSNPKIKLDVSTLTSANIAMSFVEEIEDLDSLKMFINSVRPIADPSERMFIEKGLKEAPKDICQSYFLGFWTKRKLIDPESEWKKYYEKVKYVDRKYATQIRKGFETDRGRVYLKYGKPDQLTQQKSEPSSYPYEIWHYYHTKIQNNVKFVFYNRDLAGNTYELLHSNARGEIQDYRWKMKLQQRSSPMNNIDQTNPNATQGSRVDDLFANPR